MYFLAFVFSRYKNSRQVSRGKQQAMTAGQNVDYYSSVLKKHKAELNAILKRRAIATALHKRSIEDINNILRKVKQAIKEAKAAAKREFKQEFESYP